MTQANSTGQLRQGALGPLAIAFFVISAAGPLVAMAGGIPVAMLFGNGPGTPMIFLVLSVILLAFSAGYTAMAREIRNAGAFYAFAARGLGGTAAGATGLIALFSYNAMQIGLYGLFGMAAKGLIEPVTHVILPWWTYSLAALASIACLGYRQVDLSAKILGLLVACEYLVVLILDAAIVAAGGSNGLSAQPFAPATVMTGSPAIGLMLCFGAFIGFEATTIYSEEARNPERTVPLATYFSVILIGSFYMFSTWAVVNGAGVDQLLPILGSDAGPAELLFNLSGHYVGNGLSLAMRVLFVTSTYASLLAFHNATARYFFAMGREGILPLWLAGTHKRFLSPHIGSITQTSVALAGTLLFALAGADPVLVVFTLSSAVATIGIITLMAITSAASIVYLGRQRKKPLTVALAVFSLFALAAITLLATIRFDVLASSGALAIRLLPMLVALAGFIGVVMARRLKRRDAAQFARLGMSRAI